MESRKLLLAGLIDGIHERALKELGLMMHPPLGKSGVNHRLRKLSETAEKLRRLKEDM